MLSVRPSNTCTVKPRTFYALGILTVVLAVGLAIAAAPSNPGVDGDGNATVVLSDGTETVAEIDAELAATDEERYTGLSEHESLADDEGMLFVHQDEGDLTYVMRNMDFGIDILFVDSDGCITAAHAAPEPGPDEDGSEQRYSGHGQYVVEVNIGVATDAGVEAGDPVRLEYEDTVVDGTDANC